MAERFLKFIPSQEAMWLLKNKGHAFRLLTIIAERARRENGNPDGLTIGQCHIGDWENMGLTRQEYRTALNILILKKFIEIVETCRTRKKSTTGSTTVGTLVKLCDSRVYDINPNDTNHRINHCPTTDQPPTNHEQEGIRKKKKEKEEELPHTPSVSKIKFRESVELTQDQHDLLVSKHGLEFVNLMLDKLDSFKGSNGRTYKSDYHTMKSGGWVLTQVKKDLISSKSPTENSKSYAEKLCSEFPEHKNGRGWRCYFHTDRKKDQRGILFEFETAYQAEFFVALNDGEFTKKCEDFISMRKMREKC